LKILICFWLQERERERERESMTLPPRLVIVVGTYDGVLGGWERQINGSLKLTLASAVHQGSLRSLEMAASVKNSGEDAEAPGTLLSCGYDEMLKTHDWAKRLNSSGELRTPAEFGTPICCSFAPPAITPSTHCMIGFTGGKLALYKKRDWSLQHVLAGHEGGISSLGVHPTGKFALSGGQSDGKLKLWDLTKGRLAYVTKVTTPESGGGVRRNKSTSAPIMSIVWTKDGSAYAWSHGTQITVRDVNTGKDLLDVEVPSRVNQIAIMTGDKGIFVAAACNNGSLPVLAVDKVDKSEDAVRRAILAIEPVDKLVAGDERFKCIQALQYDHGYYVVTANSAGVVSVMNLEGAVKMILSNDDELDDTERNDSDNNDYDDFPHEKESDEDDFDQAVDILASVQLGTGARITCLTAWCSNIPIVTEEEEKLEESAAEEEKRSDKDEKEGEIHCYKDFRKVEMDSSTVEKARALVKQAKKMESRKKKRQRKK